MHACLIVLLALLLTACGSQPQKPTQPSPKPACDCPALPIPLPEEPKPAPEKPAAPKIPDYGLLKLSSWDALSALEQDNLVQAWPAWLQSCSTLKTRQFWQTACTAAQNMVSPDQASIRSYLQTYFDVYQTTNVDGTDEGLITGYYQPLLRGSRLPTAAYRYPLYSRPDDLITVELTSLFPELANKRVRGRVVGTKLIPYYDRGEIESPQGPLRGRELFWVEDIVELFFLQIQGSGVIRLDNGEQVHVGYADQNGFPYQSIGRLLIQRGELTADKASMQGIKNWASNNPDKLRELLNSNPSYVFFRELPPGLPGPLGALGVPILAERAVAIDPRFVPLGAPVFVSTTYPNSNKPLNRLMMAQDTGGAIKGGVRADFFWGAGNDAGRQAGAMKQRGKIWVLLPHGFPLPTAAPAP
jgi:membrane-bound lytic murein transglycosylase A